MYSSSKEWQGKNGHNKLYFDKARDLNQSDTGANDISMFWIISIYPINYIFIS